MSKPLFIGLLSGTSMDAVDVALVSFESFPPTIVHTLSYPIPESYRHQCLNITQTGQASIDDYGRIDSEAGELFASAVLKLLDETQVLASDITAIGSHGQTLRHCPHQTPPYSLQIGDPNIIAERTGITTIADFRRRDIAAGGQGAPLAPAFHAAFFSSTEEERVIVNIGGISNLSILSKDKAVQGFDAGPGNCLMDAHIHTQLGQRYDKQGHFAASGLVHQPLLDLCLEDPYFKRSPPKSTGREYFHVSWLKSKIETLFQTDAIEMLEPKDIQATLLALTAESIKIAINNYAPPHAKIYVCGGGAHNNYLLDTLSRLLKRSVNTTEVLGVAPDWVEALLFAWLAKLRLEGKNANCPTVTGARRLTPLGAVFG